MPRSRTRLTVALVAALLAAASAGCSSASTSVSAPASAASVTSAAPSGQARIVIANFAYQPADLTVAPGQLVTVTNHDSTAHTLTATGAHGFDTGKIAAGASGTFTAPTTPGSYPYICTIHPFMHGTLTVRQ
ncbi:cupredoxin domain-containing protein [Streptacidiphilus jiangxiensis]|uniref:Plastocyanin n=1 Tax=Streptacidiphilus jiangxiensis TaxID=235985 RepID=A0A1H7W9U5_STRJI|nr:cupredoxin domain-containing protein [Streptacidiphilus jiangxiensis]SEM18261.1 Plastocyanin [Streptacidiphilus jiangxiensis]